MATTVVTPKSATKLIAKQSSLQFPINYTGETGLSSLLAEMIAAGKSVEYITTSQFINGNIPNAPDGYVQAAYQLPGAIQQNVISGSDNITVVKSVDVYVIGSDSDKFTSNFQLKMFQGNFTIGGSVVPAYIVGQDIMLIFYKNTNVGISSFGAGINKTGLQTAKFLESLIGSVKFTYVAPNELIINGTNFNTGIVQKWDTLKTTNKTYLVDALNELYDLAFAGGAGPAGGVLTGNYPNPTIKANGIVNSMIGQYQVNERTIAANSVSTSRLMDESVTTAKIAQKNVTSSRIADLAITTAQLAANAVKTIKIEDGAVTTPKIANGAVTTDKIAVGAVMSPLIANKTIQDTNMADESIGYNQLKTPCIGEAKITDSAVTTPKIANGAVTMEKIANASINVSKLSSDIYPMVTMGFMLLQVRCKTFVVEQKYNNTGWGIGVQAAYYVESSVYNGMQLVFNDAIGAIVGVHASLCVNNIQIKTPILAYRINANDRKIFIYFGQDTSYTEAVAVNILLIYRWNA